MTHLTALEQQREDQTLGAAWRRCEAALPKDSSLSLKRYPDGSANASSTRGISGTTIAYQEWQSGPTPTAALEALADALEARRAAE